MKLQTSLFVRGMDCADETSVLRRALGTIPGVDEVSFDLFARSLTVSHDDERVSANDLVRAVAAAGLSASAGDDGDSTASDSNRSTHEIAEDRARSDDR